MNGVVQVASASQPGEHYRVLVGVDGAMTCVCAGYEYRRTCRHITEVRKELPMTNESTALVPISVQPRQSTLPSRAELDVMGYVAKAALAGGAGLMIPKELNTPGKVFTVMMAGYELGLAPMTSLRHINIVNGRPEPDGQVMAGMVLAHEPDARIEVVELTEALCTMRLVRPSRDLDVRFTYNIEDAKRAGLIKQGNPWDKYPKDMMRWAATKRLCRAYAPDLINGVGSFDAAGGSAFMEGYEARDESAATQIIDIPSLPVGALYNDGDEPDDEPIAIPTNVDVETGEIHDDEPVDAEPEADDTTLLDAARAWVEDAAKAERCTTADVHEALNANIVIIASDLDAHQRRWAELVKSRAAAERKAPAKAAPTSTGLEPAAVRSRPMLRAYAKQKHGLDGAQLLELLQVATTEDLDEIAEKEGGWEGAAAFLDTIAAPAGVTA